MEVAKVKLEAEELITARSETLVSTITAPQSRTLTNVELLCLQALRKYRSALGATILSASEVLIQACQELCEDIQNRANEHLPSLSFKS